MGRLEFTSAEIAQIRGLLVELGRADRDAQKSLRAKLRRIGFYISDVSHDSNGLTARDLNAASTRDDH